MLVISRRPDESLTIDLDRQQPNRLSAADLFRYGPITIKVLSSGHDRARIGIDAPSELIVLRSELDVCAKRK